MLGGAFGGVMTDTVFVAPVVADHPTMNASIDVDAGEIRLLDDIHLGVAVEAQGCGCGENWRVAIPEAVDSLDRHDIHGEDRPQGKARQHAVVIAVQGEPQGQGVRRRDIGAGPGPRHRQVFHPQAGQALGVLHGLQQQARIDGHVVIAIAHQEQLHAAHFRLP